MMDAKQMLAELKTMIGPIIAEYISMVEERIDKKFATLLERLKSESEQTHNTVLENQKLILSYLSNPSSSSSSSSYHYGNLNLNLNSSPPGFDGLFYQHDNNTNNNNNNNNPSATNTTASTTSTTMALDLNHAQTSRQRAIANNNMVKAAQKKKREEEGVITKKRKTINPVVASSSGGSGSSSWEFPVIEESAFPLTTPYTSELIGNNNISGISSSSNNPDGSVMVITESNRESTEGQWDAFKPYDKSVVVSKSPSKKKITIVPTERHCDACGNSIPEPKYWSFYKAVMPEKGNSLALTTKSEIEASEVSDALELYVKKKDEENGGSKRKGRKLIRVGGSTCHQCHLRQPKWVTCYCGRRFCSKCLAKYNDTVENANVNLEEWHCPFCLGVCNCAACRRIRPAGVAALPVNPVTFELCLPCGESWSNSNEPILDDTGITMSTTMKYMNLTDDR